ncbi:MAG: polyphosphate kinase 1 [Acidimicrobiales bacterium]
MTVPAAAEGADGPSEPSSGAAVARFINRELSWLDFAERLLHRADDPRVPLLERVRFLVLFSEGLDQFFEVGVAAIEDQIAAGIQSSSPDGLTPREQRAAIIGRVGELVGFRTEILLAGVLPALAGAGVVIAGWDELGPAARQELSDRFDRLIFPTLTPLAVDRAHPFPYISNLCLNLVVRVTDPKTGDGRVARVKVPPVLPRLLELSDGRTFVAVEEVLAAHLGQLFPSMRIDGHFAFRVTRNADVFREEGDAADALAAVEDQLHRRRFGQAVRLEVASDLPGDLLSMLVDEVGVSRSNVSLVEGPIDLTGLAIIAALDRPELSPPKWSGVIPAEFPAGADFFAELDGRDVLVHHPYQSYSASVEAFLAAAAADEHVLAIKQTLYRAGGSSPVVDWLIRASRSGKEVTAVVELQAQFDERSTIDCARALEEAGVQVVYGLSDMKVHAKMCLVVRARGDVVRRYCHIGTGNYNPETAVAYEDLGLFTADADIGSDIGELFNLLTGSRPPEASDVLMTSPIAMRSALLAAIVEEELAGGLGRIVLKVNSLTDPEIIDALYRASRAGTSVDLIVRGRCALRPGVPQLSERIRVRSVIGRYLEHSRIFCFGGPAGRTARVLIGSADLTERSLDRRVEVMVPIRDPGIAARLADILDWALRDGPDAWLLGPDGRWSRPAPIEGSSFRLQRHCYEWATASTGLRSGAGRVGLRALQVVPAHERTGCTPTPVPEAVPIRRATPAQSVTSEVPGPEARGVGEVGPPPTGRGWRRLLRRR